MMQTLSDKLKETWQNLPAKVTLEPVIFAFVFSNWVGNGAQQNTNLLWRKVCTDRMGYNTTLCQNHKSHPQVHLEVLREANM